MTIQTQAQDLSAPVIAGDFADPSVIRAGNRYYAVGTSSEWAPHFPVYSSPDMKSWTHAGYVFDKMPEWTSGSFWAPEYYFHNNTYYIYYTARRKSDNVSCIGVATSRYPDRGFKDHGIIVAFGKEAIDAFVYNDNGQLYMTFKAYGLDKRPIEILGSKLSADGLKLEGEIFPMLKDDERIGMEGQSILKKDGMYYLFYSAGNCCGSGCSYHVRVARSASFKGPYEKQPGDPLLSENDYWKCAGHGTFVQAGKDELYYLYHAYNKQSTVFTGRQGMLAKLSWNGADGWPTLAQVATPRPAAARIRDEFNGNTIAKYWQYDFRNANPVIKQANGKLRLSGSYADGNLSGIALAVRPASAAFEMETTVTNQNAALKGLVFYGDANAAVGIGVTGNKVLFWMVKDDKRSVIDSAVLNAATPVQLKFSAAADHSCRVYYREKAGSWQELGAGTAVSVAFLPPWDRSPRAGLSFAGETGTMAEFERFEIR